MSTHTRISQDQNGSPPTESSVPTIQPLARWIHYTLAISPLPLRAGLSGIGPAKAKLSHDEACVQLKGPRSASLLSLRSLIDINGRPFLLNVWSKIIISFPKSCTWQRYHTWMMNSSLQMMRSPLQVSFHKTNPYLVSHIILLKRNKF